jgi:hypothetical protein
MVYDTSDNVDHHINTMAGLRDGLETINEEEKYFERVMKNGSIH